MKDNLIEIFKARIKSNKEGVLSFENRLMSLFDFGTPSLYFSDDGTCRLSVKTGLAINGVDFEIKSDFNHKTPTLAMNQLESRMEEIFNTLEGSGIRMA